MEMEPKRNRETGLSFVNLIGEIQYPYEVYGPFTVHEGGRKNMPHRFLSQVSCPPCG